MCVFCVSGFSHSFLDLSFIRKKGSAIKNTCVRVYKTQRCEAGITGNIVKGEEKKRVRSVHMISIQDKKRGESLMKNINTMRISADYG